MILFPGNVAYFAGLPVGTAFVFLYFTIILFILREKCADHCISLASYADRACLKRKTLPFFWSRKAKKKEEEKIDGAFVEGICFLFEK